MHQCFNSPAMQELQIGWKHNVKDAQNSHRISNCSAWSRQRLVPTVGVHVTVQIDACCHLSKFLKKRIWEVQIPNVLLQCCSEISWQANKDTRAFGENFYKCFGQVCASLVCFFFPSPLLAQLYLHQPLYSSSSLWRQCDWWNSRSIFTLLVLKLHDETSQFDRVSDRSVFLRASLESHTVTHTAVVHSLIEHMVIPL